MKTCLFALVVSLPLSACFADDAAVLGIFEKRCASCHREDETPALHGGINLFSLRNTEGEAENILDRVTRAEEAKGRMPKSKGKAGEPGYLAPLAQEEIEVLRVWAKGEAAPAASGTGDGKEKAEAGAPRLGRRRSGCL